MKWIIIDIIFDIYYIVKLCLYEIGLIGLNFKILFFIKMFLVVLYIYNLRFK